MGTFFATESSESSTASNGLVTAVVERDGFATAPAGAINWSAI